MSQSHVENYVHIVFSTKNREPFLTDDIRDRTHQYMSGIVRNIRCFPLAIGGVENHVHLLVGLKQEVSLSAFVRTIKSNSSRWIHESFPLLRTFEWQVGYGAFTVSPDRLERVARYIMRQEEHHRSQRLEGEMMQLTGGMSPEERRRHAMKPASGANTP